MRNVGKIGWGWKVVGILLSFFALTYVIGARGETKRRVTSPDGRFIAYGIEAANWVNEWALLFPPLQGQTGARFVVIDTRTGRTQKVFALPLGYDDVMSWGKFSRVHDIFWSQDSTTVLCAGRSGRLVYPEDSDLYMYAFAFDKGNFKEAPVTSWVADYLFNELFSGDAARSTVAKQLINEFNMFNEGVGHLALWCMREEDTMTLNEWGRKAKDAGETVTGAPDARLSEYKPGIRLTVLHGKSRPYWDASVRSAWNTKGLFLFVQAEGDLQECVDEADVLQNGCSSVRMRLSRDPQTLSKEYVFARIGNHSTSLAGTTGKTLLPSKSAKCYVGVSAKTKTTNWWVFIPWSDPGILSEEVQPGHKLSFAMTLVSKTTLGTEKKEWFPEADGASPSTQFPDGKVLLMP